MDAPQAEFEDGYALLDYDPWREEKRLLPRLRGLRKKKLSRQDGLENGLR